MEANIAKVNQASAALSLQQSGSRPEEIDRAEAQVVAAAGTLQTSNESSWRSPATNE